MNKSIEQIAKEEKKAYLQEWRRNNKDKVKKHNANYWKRRAEKKLKEQEAE